MTVTDYSALQQLLEIDSPTGYTYDACDYVVEFLEELGFTPTRTNKGAVKCQFGESPTLTIAAHKGKLTTLLCKLWLNFMQS